MGLDGEHAFHHACRPFPFTRCQRRLDPFGEHVLLLIPGAGPKEAEAQLFFTEPLSGLRLERLDKESMIAIPGRLASQRLQEEAGALHLPEYLLAVPFSRDRIAKRGRHTAEQAGL